MKKKLLSLALAAMVVIQTFGYPVFAKTIKNFDASYYAANSPDVVAVLGTDPTALYNHYQNHGKVEGRLAYAGATAGENVATPTASNSKKTAAKSDDGLQVVNSGVYFVPDEYSGTTYIEYPALIRNSSTTQAISFPEVTFSAQNSDGTVLAADKMVGFYSMPGNTTALGRLVTVTTSSLRADTQFIFGVGKQQKVKASRLQVPSNAYFTITNVSVQQSDYYASVTGQLTYTYPKEQNMVRMDAVFYKNGAIVYSAQSYLDNIAPGSTTAFSISADSANKISYDYVQVYAQAW